MISKTIDENNIYLHNVYDYWDDNIEFNFQYTEDYNFIVGDYIQGRFLDGTEVEDSYWNLHNKIAYRFFEDGTGVTLDYRKQEFIYFIKGDYLIIKEDSNSSFCTILTNNSFLAYYGYFNYDEQAKMVVIEYVK